MPNAADPEPPRALSPWRERLWRIIFKADTPAGKFFDVLLLVAIACSVLVVMLDSVEEVREQHRAALVAVEWLFTAMFTVEYVLRLLCVRRPWRYARSFFGVIDLLSIIPTYLSLFIPSGPQYLVVIRILRLLRLFRIFKMGRYLGQANIILMALRASREKIVVFLFGVVALVIIVGTLIYLIEGPESGFTSIPRSAYWAIVTVTTVGYGDIAPVTPLGQLLAAATMLMGYAIIAVPTGIVGLEIQRSMKLLRGRDPGRSCHGCGVQDHDEDARYCKVCGERLDEPSAANFEIAE
ncbi:MAG TPA: ion transporter [Verrucomicrobiales bacterium]|nr:ion transporter [Verrucomicrobiales bacterium]